MTRVEAALSQLASRNVDLALRVLTAQTALLAARETLHDADFAHRHEVAREGEAVCRVYRKIVDAGDELGIGETARARSNRLRAFEHCCRRCSLRGFAHSAIDRLFESQGVFLRRGRKRPEQDEVEDSIPHE